MYKEELPIKKKLLMEFCANCQSTTCDGCLVSDLFFALKNAAQQKRAADECPHCHAKPAYTDQQTYPDICSECGTRR